jgi:glycosyltransferase involved in cell wall biosynthesis
VLFLDKSLLLPLKSRWILLFKRLYLNYHKYNTDFFFVQTQHVKKIVIDNLNLDSNKIHVLPFFQELNHKIDHASKKENKFLYVSEGYVHKNHRNLLRAWEIINKTAPHLQLYLTISNSYPNLLDVMESMKARGVNVINLGIIPKNELILEYLDSKYLIYPSTNESFGLGLIEGIQLGVEVIASDLPFVYNVCNPISVFNPFDVNSIVKSVLETVHDNSCPTTVIKINNEIEKWISFIS